MPTLYLDMDGVLADFNHRARELLGATDEQEQSAALAGRWPDAQWKKLVEDRNFYRKLPKTSIADALVDLARKFRDELGWDLKILTAIPRGNDVPEAFQDKIEWVQQYYPDIRVHFGPYSKDKQHHARMGDYLVDDRADNCLEWQRAGGTAIKVNDSDPAAALSELAAVYDRRHSDSQLVTQV